ncbi:MAG TPA: hypothetical protein VJT32_04180 [bacterium]|nr:hypothetical protein [bacterium]
MAKGKAKGRTANPKFKGTDSKRVGGSTSSGMNTGGTTDAKARTNVATQGTMLHKQLKKNKSAGMKPPGK